MQDTNKEYISAHDEVKKLDGKVYKELRNHNVIRSRKIVKVIAEPYLGGAYLCGDLFRSDDFFGTDQIYFHGTRICDSVPVVIKMMLHFPII